jgi:hypothetical protein
MTISINLPKREMVEIHPLVLKLLKLNKKDKNESKKSRLIKMQLV